MYKDMIIRVLYEWRGGTKRTRAVGMRDSVVWMDARKVVSMYKEMNETWREADITRKKRKKRVGGRGGAQGNLLYRNRLQ